MKDLEMLVKKYKDYRRKVLAFRYFDYVIGWDTETIAPSGCMDDRSEYLGFISEETYKLNQSEETKELINELYSRKEELDKDLAFEISEIKRNNDRESKVPMEEIVEYTKLLGSSHATWLKAKQNDDFSMFAPHLEKIVEFLRKYVKYLETDEIKGYDVLLDEYERGFSSKTYDEFFGALEEKLVPFVKKVASTKLNYNKGIQEIKVPISKQVEFVKYIQDVMCFRKENGAIAESEHPFTSGFNNSDVRITVHYYEDLPTSSIFSAVHELGHATYEQQVDNKYNNTLIGGGASMALHESQSRFYENIIGRSFEFWSEHYKKYQEITSPQFDNISLEDFYKSINEATCSFIRVEADELTYPLHIMLRYNLERDLINSKLEVKDLEAEWNKRFEEIFALKVTKASEGVLQDVHWAHGSIGYFPTYALGSAYGSQILAAMNNDFDVFESLKTKNTAQINKWLKEHIHKFGASDLPNNIFESAVKGKFDPNYYVDYLINKFKKVYGL